MIRVGLPEWTQRLDDRQVAQITLNIADLLRRLPAKIHTPPTDPRPAPPGRPAARIATR